MHIPKVRAVVQYVTSPVNHRRRQNRQYGIFRAVYRNFSPQAGTSGHLNDLQAIASAQMIFLILCQRRTGGAVHFCANSQIVL